MLHPVTRDAAPNWFWTGFYFGSLPDAMQAAFGGAPPTGDVWRRGAASGLAVCP